MNDDNLILGHNPEDVLGTVPLPTKDMLVELFQMQYNLTNRYMEHNYGGSLAQITELPFKDEYGDPGLRERIITYSCDMIAEEAFELKRNFNYKIWKKYRKVDEQAAKEELVDIWHFILQVSLEMGLTPETLVEEFRKKNQKNHERQDSGTY